MRADPELGVSWVRRFRSFSGFGVSPLEARDFCLMVQALLSPPESGGVAKLLQKLLTDRAQKEERTSQTCKVGL